MAHLIAARFESIGHRDARLDGLVLDFTHKGSPCDSVLWLRNGGGKSSILNLLFSVLRPSQHEFLGTGAEGKLRELRDYLGTDEVGQICLEWSLDARADEAASRLFTGACIDQRSSDGQPFKRLWYAVRVPGSSPLRIGELPIVDTGPNGKKRVLRPTALRDRLSTLDDGETTVTFTDVQRDWEKCLISFGIDPAVFKYQLEMNKREGAADDLFRFGSSEEFAEFILDMVLDPSAADEVGLRLADLRHKLARRPDLETEHAALDRTAPRLRDLVEIGDARHESRQKTRDTLGATAELAAALSAGAALKAAAEGEAKQAAAREQERHNGAANRRHNGTWALEVYAWRKALLEERVAADESKRNAEEVARADREKRTLDLVPVLEQIEAISVERAERRRALEATLEKNRPLLDDLGVAAASLVAAIDVEFEALQARIEFGGRKLAESTTKLESTRETIATETEALGGLKATHQAKSTELSELERHRAELTATGALMEGEPARRGLQRHLRAAEAEVQRARETAEKAALAEQQALEKERLRSNEVSTAGRAQEQRRAAEEAISSAQLELKRIADDEVLQRTLEDSNPDLMRLAPQALARLASARARLHEQLVILGIESQLDQRALDSLTGGQALLPPSVDAERVQMALRAAGLNAFAGVAYLADNLTPERAETRIRARPELAAGVVLDESDLAAAGEVLGRTAVAVEAPVAIGKTAELIAEGGEKLVVLPPRASFDRAAALQERERRVERSSERHARLDALRKEQTAIDAISARLQAFAERHPPAWFDDHRRNVERLRREETEASARAATLAREIEEARSVAAGARAENLAALESERKSRQLASRVESFVNRGGAEIESLARAVTSISAKMTAVQGRIAALGEERGRLEHEIESRKEDQRSAHVEVQALRAERVTAAEHARGSAGAGMALLAARERFRVLREQVAREVGNDVLQAQVEQLTKQVERERKKFDAELGAAGVTEDDVRLAQTLARSTVGIEESRRRASKAVEDARQRLVDAKAQLKVAEKEVKEATARVDQRRSQRRGVVEELTAECATWTIERFAQEMPRVRADVEAAAIEEAETKTRWDEAQALARTLEGERNTFESFLPRLSDAMAGAPEGFVVPRVVDVSPIERLDGVAYRVERQIDELQQSLKGLRAAEQRAQRAVSELNSFIREDAQAKLPAQLKDRLADPNADGLLSRARDFAVDVEKRAATIRDELATIDQHRKVVAQSLQAVTDPALRVLKRLEPASVFPPAIAVWEGSPFIRAKLRVPEAAAERDAIASTLIDQLVGLGEIPSGLKLVKRLVRELAGPNGLRIEILKPEPIRRLLYEPVEHLGKFSRGEQLTAAILLYCTLAQQRATSRGGGRAPTSVLILDNPLGTCSNPQLVELQRAMAKAHGVQLIYTTGIEDLEALARLPNIVRLKNASVDVRGRRHVNHEEEPLPIQVARVAMEEAV